MIPKIIHYCWFGKNQLPELSIKCIESWRKYCPEFEIKEWNEENFDIGCCDYVKEAYNAKKWAFVSDYARFWTIYNYGGIYLDTDVEIIKPINSIVEAGAFMALEPYKANGNIKRLSVSSGLGIAAPSGLEIYRDILEDYNDSHFDIGNGQANQTVGLRVTELLKKRGFVEKDEFQIVDGIRIYPTDYFCPIDYYTGRMKITPNTVCIHHYGMSWLNEFDKKMKRIERKYRVMFGDKIGYILFRGHRFIAKRIK